MAYANKKINLAAYNFISPFRKYDFGNRAKFSDLIGPLARTAFVNTLLSPSTSDQSNVKHWVQRGGSANGAILRSLSIKALNPFLHLQNVFTFIRGLALSTLTGINNDTIRRGVGAVVNAVFALPVALLSPLADPTGFTKKIEVDANFMPVAGDTIPSLSATSSTDSEPDNKSPEDPRRGSMYGISQSLSMNSEEDSAANILRRSSDSEDATQVTNDTSSAITSEDHQSSQSEHSEEDKPTTPRP